MSYYVLLLSIFMFLQPTTTVDHEVLHTLFVMYIIVELKYLQPTRYTRI